MPLNSKPDEMLSEWFQIADLRVPTRIGVPRAERADAQTIAFTVRFQILRSFRALRDDIGQTVDYGAVAQQIRVAAQENRAQLIETLVSEVADRLIARFPLARVEVELKKFVLADAEYVSVRTVRAAEPKV
ncbi:MAG TPA: dihydroneopterin aldolase [Chthoniobacterales bacterium]|nr:dihydroneopterin aldolase [Chthoniobacterales bacterium]